MSAWLENLVGAEMAPAATWIVSGVLLLILLFVVVRLMRGLASGTFVAGGRNRRARLAVMDAAAVDSRRRLVLVRRDDVEHLILIGGPTDVVVERDIRIFAPSRRPSPREPEPATEAEILPLDSKPRANAAEARPSRPAAVAPPTHPAAEEAEPAASQHDNAYPAPPAAAPAPTAARPETADRPQPAPAMQPAAPAVQSAAPAPELHSAPAAERSYRLPEREGPRIEPQLGGAATPIAVPPGVGPSAAGKDEDELLRDLEVSLDAPERRENGHSKPPSGPDELSLEEEMSRLLGDLSGERRQ